MLVFHSYFSKGLAVFNLLNIFIRIHQRSKQNGRETISKKSSKTQLQTRLSISELVHVIVDSGRTEAAMKNVEASHERSCSQDFKTGRSYSGR
jgi:hypothetical protein